MDEFDPDVLTELVAHIYESAVDPRHWGEFLAALEAIYPTSRVTLFGHIDGRLDPDLSAHTNYAPDDLRAYLDHFAKTSPYIERGPQRLTVGRPVHYEVMIDDDELERTELYNDYMRPRRLGHYGTGVALERSGPRSGTALSLADHRNDEDRRARQLRLVKILTPHLQRALRLHRRLKAQRACGEAARAALDRFVHAALVLDASGCVVVMNEAAQALLDRADGVWLPRDGRLVCTDINTTHVLQTAIRKCAAIGSEVEPVVRKDDFDGLAVPRSSGSALRTMMSPLPFLGGVGTSEFGSGSVLLLIIDPDAVHRTPIDWMARQFKLSPSERRLAEAVVDGMPLADAAERLGIQLSTARTRLKIIQAKTGCHRQVDLVRLALSLPVIRREGNG